MRKLAEKIVDAIDKADNTMYDEVEAVEEVLNDWKKKEQLQNINIVKGEHD